MRKKRFFVVLEREKDTTTHITFRESKKSLEQDLIDIFIEYKLDGWKLKWVEKSGKFEAKKDGKRVLLEAISFYLPVAAKKKKT